MDGPSNEDDEEPLKWCVRLEDLVWVLEADRLTDAFTGAEELPL